MPDVDARVVWFSAKHVRAVPTGLHRMQWIGVKADMSYYFNPPAVLPFIMHVQSHGDIPTPQHYLELVEQSCDLSVAEHKSLHNRIMYFYAGLLNQLWVASRLIELSYAAKIYWSKFEDITSQADLRVILPDRRTVTVSLGTTNGQRDYGAKKEYLREKNGYRAPMITILLDSLREKDNKSNIRWYTDGDLLPIKQLVAAL